METTHLKKDDDVRIKFITHDGYILHSAKVLCAFHDHAIVVTAAGLKAKVDNDKIIRGQPQ